MSALYQTLRVESGPLSLAYLALTCPLELLVLHSPSALQLVFMFCLIKSSLPQSLCTVSLPRSCCPDLYTGSFWQLCRHLLEGSSLTLQLEVLYVTCPRAILHHCVYTHLEAYQC